MNAVYNNLFFNTLKEESPMKKAKQKAIKSNLSEQFSFIVVLLFYTEIIKSKFS